MSRQTFVTQSKQRLPRKSFSVEVLTDEHRDERALLEATQLAELVESGELLRVEENGYLRVSGAQNLPLVRKSA